MVKNVFVLIKGYWSTMYHMTRYVISLSQIKKSIHIYVYLLHILHSNKGICIPFLLKNPLAKYFPHYIM